MKNWEEIKEEVKKENEKTEKIEENIKSELKGIAKDAVKKNENENNFENILAKLIFFIIGVHDFILGVAFYFILKDNKNKKWQADYFIKGALLGMVITLAIEFAGFFTNIPPEFVETVHNFITTV